MSQIVLVCPHCSMRLGASSAPAAGTMLTCPTCSKQFAAPGPASSSNPNLVPQTQPAVTRTPDKKPPPVMKPPVQPQALGAQPAVKSTAQLTQSPSKPPQVAQKTAPANAPAPAPTALDSIAPAYSTLQPYQSPQAFPQPARSSSKGLIIGLSVAGGVLVLVLVLIGAGLYMAAQSFSPVVQNPGMSGSIPGLDLPSVSGVKPKPPRRLPETLEDCIEDIRSSDQTFSQMFLALNKLTEFSPQESRREEVAGLLDPLLTARESSVRSGAFRAVKVWGTQRNVPTLLKILETGDRSSRSSAMEALGNMGSSQQVAEALAKQMLLDDDRSNAARALEEMGPVAEDVVWQHMESRNSRVQSSACSVLAKIGTKKSLPKIRELIQKSESDISRKVHLEIAEREIERRVGTTEGTGGIFD